MVDERGIGKWEWLTDWNGSGGKKADHNIRQRKATVNSSYKRAFKAGWLTTAHR